MSTALSTIDSLDLEHVHGGNSLLPVIAGAGAVINSNAFTCGVGALGGYFDGNTAGTAMREWANCMRNDQFQFPSVGQAQPSTADRADLGSYGSNAAGAFWAGASAQ